MRAGRLRAHSPRGRRLTRFVLAVAAARAYPTVHVASWPQHFSPSLEMQPVIVLVSKALAYSVGQARGRASVAEPSGAVISSRS
jgi:hypothetical protein